jgi:hypothetical protein
MPRNSGLSHSRETGQGRGWGAMSLSPQQGACFSPLIFGGSQLWNRLAVYEVKKSGKKKSSGSASVVTGTGHWAINGLRQRLGERTRLNWEERVQGEEATATSKQCGTGCLTELQASSPRLGFGQFHLGSHLLPSSEDTSDMLYYQRNFETEVKAKFFASQCSTLWTIS